MPIVETGNKTVDRNIHGSTVREFDELVRSDGWKKMEAFLHGEIANAFVSMQVAKNGDEAIKASTAFVIMSNIVKMPYAERDQSVKRLQEIEKEEEDHQRLRARQSTNPGRNVP